MPGQTSKELIREIAGKKSISLFAEASYQHLTLKTTKLLILYRENKITISFIVEAFNQDHKHGEGNSLDM